MSNKFIHEDGNFKELIQIVARNQKIKDALVEKDYWLMHCLWGLAAQEFVFELKGGTSLSKGYGLIKRFSEDVDIRINPPNEWEVIAGKNKDKEKDIESRRNFYQKLCDTISIPGIISIDRDTSFDDKKLRSAGIKLNYSGLFEKPASMKQFVLLEVGFEETVPNEPRNISSWVYDHALSKGNKMKDNRAIKVPCYCPEYTLIDKIDAIVRKHKQHKAKGEMPKNFMRHYYDIYLLLREERILKFIGTPQHLDYRSKNLGKHTSQEITEAFTLSDKTVFREYETQFDKLIDFFFETPPSFRTLLKETLKLLPKL